MAAADRPIVAVGIVADNGPHCGVSRRAPWLTAAVPAERAVRRPPIVLLFIAHAVVDASLNILPVVLPLLVDRFHLTYAQVGLAAALSNVSSSLLQPAFGWAADRWPSRWPLAAGVAWTGSLMCLLGVVPNYPGLLVVIFLTGVGTAAFHPIASMGVAQAAGTQRGLGMSLFSVGGNLGFAVGPVAAAWLMVHFGLPGTLAIVFPCLMMAAVLHASRGNLTVQSAPRARPTALPSEPIPWRRLSSLCALITLRSWGYSGLITFIPLLLREQGASLASAGRALFVFLFCGALGGLAGGYLSDRVGRHRVIASSLMIFPFLMGISLGTSGPVAWFFLALAGTALLASFSVTVVYAQDLLPHRLGLASGLTLGLAFGAGGVGVGLSGLLADALGLRASVWLLLVLPGIAGLLGLTLSPTRRTGDGQPMA
jgi:FSR family fosmidomycin resistance protein-like MFS transporter